MVCLEKKAEARIPTEFGEFFGIVYEFGGENYIVLIKGDVGGKENVLVRVHSQCLTGEVFHSQKCDCRGQLEASMSRVAKEGGVILYLPQEGRGIGLANKIRAYALQEKGLDTVEANIELGFHADPRDYSIAAKILLELGIKSVRLLTNNPEKIRGLEENGVKVVERIPVVVKPGPYSRGYLKTKKEKMGHMIDV